MKRNKKRKVSEITKDLVSVWLLEEAARRQHEAEQKQKEAEKKIRIMEIERQAELEREKQRRVKRSEQPKLLNIAKQDLINDVGNTKKLIFDPKNGELVIAGSDVELHKDTVVCDNIYHDGFFAKKCA